MTSILQYRFLLKLSSLDYFYWYEIDKNLPLYPFLTL